jgi:hypothetical protein
MCGTWDRPLVRLVGWFAVPLALAASPVAVAYEGDPSHSYLGIGYLGNDVNYAVEQDGAKHEGFNLEGSLGIATFGKFGVHAYGEYFTGEFSGLSVQVEGSPTAVAAPDGDSEGYQLGLGLAYSLSDRVDLVGRAAYASTEVDLPDSQANLVAVDGDGFIVHAMVRGMVGDKVELEAGYRYTSIDDVATVGSDSVSNSDVILALTYGITEQFAVRARAIVFDTETGLEVGARWHFGRLTGRDHLFDF